MKQYENFLLLNTYNKLLNNMKSNWKIFNVTIIFDNCLLLLNNYLFLG